MDKVYRIYTEDIDRQAVIHLASQQFENFTLHETVGYYRDQPEDSIALEIVDAEETAGQMAAGRRRFGVCRCRWHAYDCAANREPLGFLGSIEGDMTLDVA